MSEPLTPTPTPPSTPSPAIPPPPPPTPPPVVPLPQKPYVSVQQQQVDEGKLWNLWFTRREFFTLSAWGAFAVFLAGSLLSFLRFFIPQVTYEPSAVFKIGKPSDYLAGEVSEKLKRQRRIWVVRDLPSDGGGLYVLWARCTHLGCTPNWMPIENKFKCPCHGSGFRRTGKNFEGPAPRPLERLKVALADDGQIVVDMNTHFRNPTDWKKPEVYLHV